MPVPVRVSRRVGEAAASRTVMSRPEAESVMTAVERPRPHDEHAKSVRGRDGRGATPFVLLPLNEGILGGGDAQLAEGGKVMVVVAAHGQRGFRAIQNSIIFVRTLKSACFRRQRWNSFDDDRRQNDLGCGLWKRSEAEPTKESWWTWWSFPRRPRLSLATNNPSSHS